MFTIYTPNIYFLDKIHSLYQFLIIILNLLRSSSAKAKAVPIVLIAYSMYTGKIYKSVYVFV